FQNHTDCPLTDFGGKTSIFSHPVYLFLRKFSLQDSRGGSLTTLPGIVIYTVMASDLANEGITLRFILQLCLAGLALFILVQLAKLYARHKHVDLSASRRSPLTHPKNEG
ncbi:hypothetical protein ACP80Z_21750, partial [Escherichia coli]